MTVLKLTAIERRWFDGQTIAHSGNPTPCHFDHCSPHEKSAGTHWENKKWPKHNISKDTSGIAYVELSLKRSRDRRKNDHQETKHGWWIGGGTKRDKANRFET